MTKRKGGAPRKATPRGNNLRACRDGSGMSVEQACEFLGVHPVTLNNWELGISRPQRNNLVRLGEVYRSHRPVWAADKQARDPNRSVNEAKAALKELGGIKKREVLSVDDVCRYRIVKEYF